MDDLTWTLNQRCRHNRDGSHTTQADRKRPLILMAHQLREAGFRQMRATSLRGKHIDTLLARWRMESLSIGTIKNRLAHLRWWTEKIGKPSLRPADNSQLGIPKRRYITNQNKAKTLNNRLDNIRDEYVKMSLRLQAAFGLRRKESLLFQPHYADRGDHIVLKSSWTKGGKLRPLHITTPEQRRVLNEAHALAGSGSMIPAHKTYIQQRHKYDGQCKNAGLSGMHGLRHNFAQMRYETLTGWKSPTAGGPGHNDLTPEQQAIDHKARQTISRDLEHEKIPVVAYYLG